MIDHLHDKFRNDSSVGIAYIYCTFKQQGDQGALDIVTNVLKQLAMGRPTLPQSLKDLYTQHKARRTRPSLSEIKTTIRHVASGYSKTFIIVDALDECQVAPNHLDKVIQEILDIQTDIKANLFATSRIIKQIESKFENAIKLSIRAQESDVMMFLRSQLGNCQILSSQTPSLREEIPRVITRAVDGM